MRREFSTPLERIKRYFGLLKTQNFRIRYRLNKHSSIRYFRSFGMPVYRKYRRPYRGTRSISENLTCPPPHERCPLGFIPIGRRSITITPQPPTPAGRCNECFFSIFYFCLVELAKMKTLDQSFLSREPEMNFVATPRPCFSGTFRSRPTATVVLLLILILWTQYITTYVDEEGAIFHADSRSSARYRRSFNTRLHGNFETN